MIKLPDSFIPAFHYAPGYFWCTKRERLYSIKSGQLKPMRRYEPTGRNSTIGPYYRVSARGLHFTWHESELLKHAAKVRGKNEVTEIQIGN